MSAAGGGRDRTWLPPHKRTPADRRVLTPGVVCMCDSVYKRMCPRKRVCVCMRAEGVSSVPGALGGELRAKPEPATLRDAGRLHR